jgi:hypothetical protein
LEPPLYVVSSWVIRVYTILITNTISRSSNLDNCFYHCLILILILHLKVLFNFFFFFFFFFFLLLLLLFLLLLLLFIIYIVNLPVVRPRSCRVIYYFDTPALRRRHQSFGHDSNMFWVSSRWSSFTSWLSNFRSFRLYLFLFFML